MAEIIGLWFLSLALVVIYTWFLYDDTFIEKVKFICMFMGVFTLACVGIMRM